MNTDKYGLPIQADGDAYDQLQRVGMIAVGQLLGSPLSTVDMDYALRWMLQLQAGTYRRYYETDVTNDVTADQLIPTVAYWSITENRSELGAMRWVFAQNTRRQGALNEKTIPDFMLLRAIPLIIRGYGLPYLVLACIDVLLLCAVVAFNIQNRGFDDVDDNNLIVTLISCRAHRPTIISYLAAKLYRATRAYSPEYALQRYHRRESGGNPEIAEQWCLLLAKYSI